MHPLRRRRLLGVTVVVLMAATIVGLVLYALRENVSLFYPPSAFAAGQVATGRTVRLGGQVVEGSVQRDASGLELIFRVRDATAAEVEVHYRGLPPDLFSAGRGVVATGQLDSNGIFRATSLLAKHDENYQPPGIQD